MRAGALASVICALPLPVLAQFWGGPQQQQGGGFFGGGGGWPWGQQQSAPRYQPRDYYPPVHRRPAARAHPPSVGLPKPGAPGAVKPGEAPASASTAPEQSAVEGPPPPYEPQLLRLSEILGALSYLRDICAAHDGDAWRTKMSTLLDAEAKSQTRRERLAGAFNRGFRGYEVIYRTCTPNAETVISRYLNEGGRIARDINYRYGAS
ncbi:MAG: TIGR02301 family protein [Methylobacteriaceae bacterium]|nr:TIGR02301 family protein [Methylobacteriaceae bacterium]